jgi:hypothetical protein
MLTLDRICLPKSGETISDKMRRKLLFTAALCLVYSYAFSQGFNISGTILDETDNSALIGVSVILTSVTDTSQKSGGVTDVDGNFNVSNISAGQYQLTARYVGFQNYVRTLVVNKDVDLGTVKMKVLSTQLQNVLVTGQQIRAQQAGDTTNFNAGAFKTNPDANAEDLINKMPGISTEGGSIKANGEDVKQVLVDGKPFFGDDPNAAIKNLPAEIIDRIQVFDKLSDQAQLTGFEDANSQRTINIITKPGRNTGQFGKIFGGYGTRDAQFKDNLYMLGGNVNFFNGTRRVSLIGMSNNVNQQNFSSDDLLGVVGQSSGQNRGGGGSPGGRGSGGPRGGRGGSGSDANPRGGGSDASNFLVGQQPGITTTYSAGINYSDNWSPKLKVSGSYFFNFTENTNTNDLSRTYLASKADSNLIYKENSSTKATNMNHRANLRMEYTIDSFNSIIFTPRVSFQDNSNERFLSATSRYADSSLLIRTSNSNRSDNNGLNLNGNLVYQHKFLKRGRTMSLNLNGQMNNRTGDGGTNSSTHFEATNTDSIIDQQYRVDGSGTTYSANLTYTEPITDKSQVMINYAPSVNKNNSDRETFDKGTDGNYSVLNPRYSNRFDNTYTTHRGGLSYRTNTATSNIMIGANYQQATLRGMQEYPIQFEVDKTFRSILPQVMWNYRFSRTKNLRLMYRTATNAPTINQLQNVIDISNPLLLKTGNVDLGQDYQHTLMLRYGNTNTSTPTNFFAMLFGSYTLDYIGNQTIIPSKDTTFGDVILKRGSQLSRPVNLDGYWSARSFLTYGMPIKAIKSNLNLNAGINYSKIPGLINTTLNYSNNTTINGGVVVSSNISENLDFTLAYSGYYNILRNSIQKQANNNYYNQNTSLRFNWIFLDNFVLNSSINHLLYSGLSEGFNQSYLLWNAAFGYKFFKDKSLDVRLSAYDILNQNRSIERTVTETYIEDNYTNVLQRYFMLNVTYTLRRFGGSAIKGSKNADPAVDSDEPGTRRPERRGDRRRGGEENQ